ncbi:MAG: phenylalanine--tRNA ligase subunit alpha [bacterium]
MRIVDIKKLTSEITLALDSVGNADQLQQFTAAYTGRKGRLTSALRALGDLPKEDRSLAGKELNELRVKVEGRVHTLEKTFKTAQLAEDIHKENIDVTLPGKILDIGSSHPLTQILSDIINICRQFGFILAEGNDAETDYFNFEALNFPENHPARDAQDTFFIDAKNKDQEKLLLRTHTSPVQIHVMKTIKPPFRALMPGRVYRHEAIDASHSAVFHQVEGLAVDTNITFADLKGMLTLLMQRIFRKDTMLRFRPSFFPFTEPSAEVDIQCIFCQGTGCGICKKTGWLEMLGAGMVHPNVFRGVGYDPEIVAGFAFGMGVERVAMLKYGVNDMRLFYDNDMRFLKQF